MNNDEENIVWFAMRAPFCKELEAKRLLDKQAIENFVPMCYKVFEIFVRTTRRIIRETKRTVPFLQYITMPDAGKNSPIIVPDIQMQQFISVSRLHNERLIYLTPEEINLAKGTRVRVLGGPFDGVEGVFVKVRGCRSKRVVILIQGILAVVVAEVKPDLIEVIG